MARTGRPPKPIEQHKAEGTLRSSRHPKTPLLQGGRQEPECPDHLRGNAKRAFEIITKDLATSGIVDSADRTLIVAAAMHYGLAIDAQEALDKFGVMYPVTRGARDGAAATRSSSRTRQRASSVTSSLSTASAATCSASDPQHAQGSPAWGCEG